jgi:hypothetical protein
VEETKLRKFLPAPKWSLATADRELIAPAQS